MKTSLIFLLLFSSLAISQTQDTEAFKDVYQQYQAAVESGDPEKTLALAKEALKYGSPLFPADSENLLNLKFNLATAMHERGLGSEGFVLMKDVVSGFKTLKGNESLDHFNALSQRLKFGSKDYSDLTRTEQKGLKNLAKELMGLAESLSDEHPSHAPVFQHQVGMLMVNQGVFNVMPMAAENYVTKAYELNQSQLGELDVKTVELAFTLAKIKEAKNKPRRATELFEKVVKVLDTELNITHPYELGARARLVNLYEQRGRSDAATEHCIAIGEMTPWNDNLEPMPLFRKTPKYPMSKARARKDGLVQLTFSIDEMGFVRDPQVIRSEGGEAFESAAKEALKEWRYAPKFEQGKAIRAEGLKVQLGFKMER